MSEVANWNGYSCYRCSGTGVFLAMRRRGESPWAFRCTCNRGRNSARRFPPWGTEWEHKGFQEFDVRTIGALPECGFDDEGRP